MYENVRTYTRTYVHRSVGLSSGLSVCLSVCLYMYTSEYVSTRYNMFISLAYCVCVQCHWFLTSVSRDRAIRTLSLSRWFPSNRIQPSSNLEQSEQLQLRSLLGEAKLPTTTKSNFDFSCSQISSVQIRNNIFSDRTLATEIQRMEWMEWVMKILGLRTAVLKKLINSLAHG